MGKIFKEAFGSEQERVIVVACGQVGASGESWYPSRFLLESPIYVEEEGADPVWKSIDAYAIAPYVGDQNNEFSFNRDSPELFIEDAINYTLGLEKWTEFIEEPGLRYQIRSDYKMASEFNLPLLAYEGGQHFMGSKFTRDIVNRNRKMYDLYRTIFKVWKEEGGSLFVNFAGIIPPGNSPEGEEPDYFQSENFGIFEYQMQPISDRHKYRAILDEISKYK